MRRQRATSGLARALIGFAVAILAACSGQRTRPRLETPVDTVGVASWYGPGFHGKATSSGEIYDQEGMTAAHRTWPLGTRVRVTNLDNGRVTQIRINDRGPFVDGRDIDLSYAAARNLDMLGPGTCRVRLEPLLGASDSLAAVQFAVQVAAFQDALRAEDYRTRLSRAARANGLASAASTVYVAPVDSTRGRVYRVRVGPYALRADAESSASHLATAGLDAVVVEENVSFR